MGLKMLPGQTIGRPRSGIAPAPKVADGYYRTPEWKALREQVLRRARFKCELARPGCSGRATIADHIVSRKAGGTDDLSNLRAVCRECDNAVKEDHLGRRRGG